MFLTHGIARTTAKSWSDRASLPRKRVGSAISRESKKATRKQGRGLARIELGRGPPQWSSSDSYRQPRHTRASGRPPGPRVGTHVTTSAPPLSYIFISRFLEPPRVSIASEMRTRVNLVYRTVPVLRFAWKREQEREQERVSVPMGPRAKQTGPELVRSRLVAVQ